MSEHRSSKNRQKKRGVVILGAVNDAFHSNVSERDLLHTRGCTEATRATLCLLCKRRLLHRGAPLFVPFWKPNWRRGASRCLPVVSSCWVQQQRATLPTPTPQSGSNLPVSILHNDSQDGDKVTSTHKLQSIRTHMHKHRTAAAPPHMTGVGVWEQSGGRSRRKGESTGA